jgi:thymidylate synthase
MNNWPIYFKDKLVVGSPQSEVGIVSLWTPVHRIIDKIDPKLYALAGQLYSREGVNYIVRNIMANPKIKYIVVCGEERNGSGDALIKLISQGVDEDFRIKETEFCQIHPEIHKEDIELFRQNQKIIQLVGEIDANKIELELLKINQSNAKHWTTPREYPENKVEFDGVMPTDQSVFKIRHQYAGEVWLEMLKKIMKFGTVRESFHGNNCKELFNIASVITTEDPDNFKIYPYYQISEKDITDYIPKFMTGIKGTADYTYGERLWNFPKIDDKKYKYNQVKEVIIEYLKKYPTDRAACATIFGIQDHTAGSSPCMTFVQATNVNDKLELTAYFRSHDIFAGWILNIFGLRTLQKYIADQLNWKIGDLIVYSNCAHIYDNNWEKAKAIINKYGDKLLCTPDPRGYLLISIDNTDILIKHISPNGKNLQEFRQNAIVPRATMLLYNQLLKADIISQISHALDVGAEIQKAEHAIKLGLKYVQDQPLAIQQESIK